MQCDHPRSSSTCALCSLGTLGQNWDWKGEVWFVCQSISTSLKVKVHCSSGVRVWLSQVPGQLSKFASFAHHRLQKFPQAFFGLAQGHNKKFFIWVNGIDKQHIYNFKNLSCMYFVSSGRSSPLSFSVASLFPIASSPLKPVPRSEVGSESPWGR